MSQKLKQLNWDDKLLQQKLQREENDKQRNVNELHEVTANQAKKFQKLKTELEVTSWEYRLSSMLLYSGHDAQHCDPGFRMTKRIFHLQKVVFLGACKSLLDSCC